MIADPTPWPLPDTAMDATVKRDDQRAATGERGRFGWEEPARCALRRRGALIVDLDGFEGPLDLLLALARTQKVDLAKISSWRWPTSTSASSPRRASCGSSLPPTIS